MADFARARERMLARQIEGRGIADRRLLDAMRAVPREAFVPEDMREFAYEDGPLPIAAGQTVSQPYIVALMLEAAEIGPDDRVLEIGAGSGYAAAVMSRLAGSVLAIERHRVLAEEARGRLARLGYDNATVREGDGTLGAPEDAPFDAIVAAAGGPSVPDTLRRQLRLGGRLVMPVGSREHAQTLVKVVRLGEDAFAEESLGPVSFVPLIGAHGWSDGIAAEPSRAEPMQARRARRGPVPAAPLPELIREAAEPLPNLDDPAFGRLIDRFGRSRVVLLGEATHGTSEFYRARAAITRRLVEAHGFRIVAVEADWPDAATVDAYVRGRPRRGGPAPFGRFPTWMWRNAEVRDFLGWLREHNFAMPEASLRAGFYGLDLYSLSASIEAVLAYLDEHDSEAARVARERYGCLTRWQHDPSTYGRAALSAGYALCEEAVVAALRDLLARRLEEAEAAREALFDATQNARLIAAAEHYYRAMYYGSDESWNLRDRHMFETLRNLLDAGGTEARAVVWAHNSHIGNAAATEMGVVRDEINLGQCCREHFGRDAALIGFGTDRGTVAAASDWDGILEIKRVRPALRDSFEALCRESGEPSFLLDLRAGRHEALRRRLLDPRLQRFIGVIYRPETERWSHYLEASAPEQFDAWIWFAETRAVTPLGPETRAGTPETFPFGL
ncbi:protein-L-isoaspartate(D-aspartate) O-methyltransferase [Methylobacterium nigriterrae]|uniref:protein-L-isoaspartate(D-aspartate) O-methyltransferase n=1 Tax=Methylobacterium nigriterrae TaxID=3127512 RepID=UPI00301391DC